MGIFIALLLVSAWIQSMWKLTFYPRLLRLAVLGGLSLFIIFASERLSGYNLHDIAVLLESKERLDTLCALVVMQEFVALFFGLTLLHAVELGERAKWWMFGALLPSFLLLPGGAYLLIFVFNNTVDADFASTARFTALGVFLSGALLSELFGLWRKRRIDRAGSALSATVLLLLLAVFLPIIGAEKIFYVETEPVLSWSSAGAWSVLLITALLGALIKYIWDGIKIKRNHAVD